MVVVKREKAWIKKTKMRSAECDECEYLKKKNAGFLFGRTEKTKILGGLCNSPKMEIFCGGFEEHTKPQHPLWVCRKDAQQKLEKNGARARKEPPTTTGS